VTRDTQVANICLPRENDWNKIKETYTNGNNKVNKEEIVNAREEIEEEEIKG
jgi:hypothetical protein